MQSGQSHYTDCAIPAAKTRYSEYQLKDNTLLSILDSVHVYQCFSTAGPWPGTGTWHQLYRAARDSPGTDN